MPSARRERPALKAVVVAAVVAAVAAGAGVVSRAHYAAKAGHTSEVLALPPSAVRRMVVQSKGQQVTLLRGDDGRWTGPGVPASTETLMVSSEEELFPLRAFRTVEGDPADEQFGLADPDIVLDVDDAGGRPHRVAFGAPTFTDGGFYAATPGDRHRLYLVPRRAVYDLRSVLAGHRIDPPNDVPQKVRDLNTKAQEHDERAKVSYWLRQSLDAGTPVPGELR
jgi:hypothetical protein